MIENYLNRLNKNLVSTFDNDQIGLSNGKMGFSIYLFWLSKIKDDSEYSHIAEQLIDDVIKEINSVNSLDINNGLSGIGIGIIYLIKKGYIEGNINYLLKDIDDIIFKNLSSSQYCNSIDINTLIQLLYYLYLRIKDIQKDCEFNYLFKELINKTVNNIYERNDLKFYQEPPTYNVYYLLPQLLFILSKIYNLEYYNYRITKILDEISYKILSIIPYSQCNRLYLLWGMEKINQKIVLKGWKKHAELLRREINIEKAFNDELGPKNIYFTDGLASMFYLLSDLPNYYSSNEIKKCAQLSLELVRKSTIWNLMEKDQEYFNLHKGLYHGYCGVSIFYNILKITTNESGFERCNVSFFN